MNSMTRLSRVSAHLMTLTGFFHGVIRRMPFAEAGPPELKPYIVRYHILKQIERPGPHHPSEISAALDVKKNTLSELLDRMVRDGLLRREPDAGDRRRISLSVTPAGRAAVRAFEKNLMANMRQFLETLDEADRKDLVLAIESLIRILERHDRKSGRHFPF